MTFDFELFDDDGYPTEEVLDYIEKYDDYKNLDTLFELCFVSLWTYPNMVDKVVTDEGKYHTWQVATGGWSGNEDVVCALQANYVVWGITWELSQRGGYYEFKVKIK